MDAFRGNFADINPGIKLNRFFRGTIVDTADPLQRGRVRIRIFGIHTAKMTKEGVEGIPDEELPWAEQVAPSMGGSSGAGSFSIPTTGSIVWGFFANGDPRYPMYFGVQMGMTAGGAGGGGSGGGEGGGSSDDVRQADIQSNAKGICDVAAHHNIDPCLVQALSSVESGGGSGVNTNGTSFIRYEPHVFAREVAKMNSSGAAYKTAKVQEIAKTNPALVAPSLTNPATGKYYNNYAGQSKNHEFLNQAMAIDKEAAMKSCSWGKYQMMGFNYKSLGYSSVEEMAAAASDANRQEELLDRFITSKPVLKTALQNKNFSNIALYYNGSGQVGKYGPWLQREYNKCKASGFNCSAQSGGSGGEQTTGIAVTIL